MDNSLNLYRTIMDLIWQNGVRFPDLRLLTTFVWAVVGLLLSGQIHLSQWSLYRVGATKAASKQVQLARWLANPRIQPASLYRHLIRAALVDWEGETLYLALDSSQLWERFTVVRLALIYRGRALPVSWVVLASQSTTVAFADYQVILEVRTGENASGAPTWEIYVRFNNGGPQLLTGILHTRCSYAGAKEMAEWNLNQPKRFTSIFAQEVEYEFGVFIKGGSVS